MEQGDPHAHASDAPTGDRSPTRRRPPLWGIAAFAVIAGLSIGRFVTAGNDSTPRSSGTAAVFSTALAPENQIAALEATVATDPRDATAWRLLGTAYAERGAQTQDPALTDLAGEAFDRAAELAPGDPTVVVGRGALALTLHRFAEAEQLGREATERLPANADALGVLVDAQVELGRYDAAADTLQQLLDVRPGLPALARVSYVRELDGDVDGAKQAMRQAVVAGGSSRYDVAAVTALLGDLHRKSGDLDAAGDAYARALEDAPSLVSAQAGTAWVRAANGDIDGAIAYLRRRVDDFPTPSLLLLLHDLERASGAEAADETAELVRAVAALQEASGQVVDLEMATFEADEATDPRRAVELARRAQQARPDNVFVDDVMAWALFRAGDPASAAPFMAQALRLGTTEPLVRFHAAEISLANGDQRAAAAHLAIALRDPWFSFRHRDRALDLAEQLDVAIGAPA